MCGFSKSLLVATGALALLVAPIPIDELSPLLGSHSALADKGGGGHEGSNAGGNGGGNAGGNGNGNAGASASSDGGTGGSNAGGNGKGNAFGLSMADSHATTDGNGNGVGHAYGYGTGTPGVKNDLHPSKLGRLNAFLNASSNALNNSAPNSAVGTVSQSYRDALSAYLSGNPNVDADDVAVAIAGAANKTLTPDQVNAINERLAVENPNDPNLSGLSNPTDDPTVEAANDALAADIAARANEIRAEEENQGLGQRISAFLGL
jgi:hypothetical protein